MYVYNLEYLQKQAFWCLEMRCMCAVSTWIFILYFACLCSKMQISLFGFVNETEALFGNYANFLLRLKTVKNDRLLIWIRYNSLLKHPHYGGFVSQLERNWFENVFAGFA